MKKQILCAAALAMSVLLVACSGQKNTETAAQTKETSAATDTGNSVDYNKPVDMDAEDEEVLFIYIPTEDGYDSYMEDVKTKELTAQALVDLMISHGLLEEGTTVLSFETGEDLNSDEIEGPGVVKLPDQVVNTGIKATGVLNLSALPNGGADEKTVYAVARTFMETMKVVSLDVQLDGKTLAEGLTADDVE